MIWQKTIGGLLLCSLICYSAQLDSASYSVTSNTDSGSGSLRQAILDLNKTGSPAGNLITINEGLPPITLQSDLPPLGKKVAILTNGAVPQVIDGQGKYRLFTSFSTTFIQNCMLIKGAAFGKSKAPGNGFLKEEKERLGAGGAIYIDKNQHLTLRDSVLSNNFAKGGAPVESNPHLLQEQGEERGRSNCSPSQNKLRTVKGNEKGVGGGVFVGESATLCVQDNVSLTSNTVVGGKGGGSSSSGELGSSDPSPTNDIFLFNHASLLFDTKGILQANFSIQSHDNGSIFTDKGIIKQNCGIVALSSMNNNFRGGTQILGGALTIAADTNLGHPSGKITFNNGGILQATESLSMDRKIVLEGDGIIDVTRGNTVTLLAPISGSGKFFKHNVGTLILNGPSYFSNETVIRGGVLQGNSTNLQGDIVNNATVVFDQEMNGNYNGRMTGKGSLIKKNAGKLTLGGQNSHVGGIIVKGGILQAGVENALPSSGEVHLSSSTAVLDLNHFNQTIEQLGGVVGSLITTSSPGKVTLVVGSQGNQKFDGMIENGSGALSLIKQGSGSLTLTGVNRYEETVIAGGTLKGNTKSLQGRIINHGMMIFDQPNLGHFNGEISGSGSIKKLNVGTVVFTSKNSHTGGTIVRGGMIQGNTETLQGDIVNEAMITFDQPFPGVYSGNFSGMGSIIKKNKGTLIWSSNSTSFTGSTSVAEGTLHVLGGLGGSISVQPGGVLKGTGTVGSVQNDGMVVPGGSIGTFFVAGNYSQTVAGTLSVEVNSSGAASLLIAGGTATLGGSVLVNALPGIYLAGTTYPIIEASSIIGSFSNVINNQNNFYPTYLPGLALLTVQNNSLVPPIPLSGNAGAVSNYLFCSAFPYNNTDLVNIGQSLLSLSSQQIVPALNTLTPAQFGALPLSELEANYRMGNSLFDDFNCPKCLQGQTRIKVTPLGFFSKENHNQKEVPHFNQQTYGVTVAAEHGFDSRFNIGGGVGYSYNKIRWKQNQGNATSNSVYFGPTVGYCSDHFYSSLVLLGTGNFYDVHRKINYPGLSRIATHHQTNWDLLVKGVIGKILHWKSSPAFTIKPSLSIDYFNSFEGEYHEAGAGSLNLNVSHHHSAYLKSLLAVQFAHEWEGTRYRIRPGISLGWMLTAPLTNNQYTSSFSGLNICSSQFTVKSYHNTLNQLQVGANLCFLGENYSVDLAYDGIFCNGNSIQEGIFSLSYQF